MYVCPKYHVGHNLLKMIHGLSEIQILDGIWYPSPNAISFHPICEG